MKGRPTLGSFRKRLSGRRTKDKEDEGGSVPRRPSTPPRSPNSRRSFSQDRPKSRSPVNSPNRPHNSRRSHSLNPSVEDAATNGGSEESVVSGSPSSTSSSRGGRSRDSRPNILQRMRERSRSRSRSRKRDVNTSSPKEMLVAVTSCRSDGYYNQKAPGSTSKLPRKAPTNLKLFHELAVGVKDAYAAVGATPRKLTEEEEARFKDEEKIGRTVLWDFVGNLDFLLALVDEVAVDTITRGALKDDSTFKGLRDVIKKGNRVLEEMLVRRERKYTLFFRLVQSHDRDQIDRMRSWNQKVEKAVGAVTGGRESLGESENDSDTNSISSNSSASVSSRAGVFSRGRQLLPTAGRVRSRRATPTPRLRKHRSKGDITEDDAGAAEDGFSTVSMAPDSAQSPKSSSSGGDGGGGMLPPAMRSGGQGNSHHPMASVEQVRPKDELVDVIRGLRVDKIRNQEGSSDKDLAELKPNWRPKAEIPPSVPKLPTEYVHRHRLMKQVVSCLLDENEPPKNEDGSLQNTIITCVTSRHGDKAGNGKSTLAIAVIQTVEVRERFPNGIAWLKLGRGPLSERDIRRLYEDLYRQLVVKQADIEGSVSEADTVNFHESFASTGSARTEPSETRIDRTVDRADSVRRFEGGDLEGIKEDLGRMLVRQKVLVCLDDVWRVEDAKWFIFETPSYSAPPRNSPYKILITTRTPSLLGAGAVQEVFVRILSEHEAVKLLLSTAGRRPYGGRNSTVFNQSKLIVKGCGNSPLGIILVGSMLREYNRNWNLTSPVWTGIFNQCSLNLEEAAQLRSFRNAFNRVVDTALFTIEDSFFRIALRRCFVYFAMGFRANDWMLSGIGIPQSIILKFFRVVIAAGPRNNDSVEPEVVLAKLENLKLIQRARHSVTLQITKPGTDSPSVSSHGKENGEASEKSESDWDDFDEIVKPPVQHCYTMHDSLKAVAELMAQRALPSFTPAEDQFTYFSDLIRHETDIGSGENRAWSAPLRFLFQHLSPQTSTSKSSSLTNEHVHELVVIALLGGGDGKALSKSSVSSVMKANQISMQLMEGGTKFEEYTMSFIIEHLMLSRSLSSTSELITDSEFVRRRVFALGIMEATGRQVADILDLRGFAGKGGAKRTANTLPSPTKDVQSPNIDRTVSEDKSESNLNFDVEEVLCAASRIIIDEVYKATNTMGSSDSLGMATCLATVGETLLKCRQPRDAMLRLEEAVSIYRGLLGPYHVYTAHALHSTAKALGKLGETRVALLKFAEAARIYEACNATLHYDSITNAQSLAALLVDIGDIRKAESMFEEVISMKRAVYGEFSVPVAKTINSYAILLAKHARMKDALRNYELAKSTYQKAPPALIVDPEFDVKCKYDVTLINLNIASIYSKKGDLQRALTCYEDGVTGLEQYEASMDEIRESDCVIDVTAKHSSHKHLVAALGRIGSLKLKLGDNEGALEAYLSLIEQVDEDSPIASYTEQAKAHIKCATIFRQRNGEKNRDESISHLKEALRMYKALYGNEHKDTTAISTSLKQWLAEDKQPPN
jgi:tetratricopeptide (TPR) repeat protein